MVRVGEELNANIVLIMNGKVAGGRQFLNPLGCINDGLMEITYSPGIVGFGPVKKMSDGAVAGGIHCYDPFLKIMRIKKLRLDNKHTIKNKETNETEPAIQNVMIDGEDLTFKRFVKMECLREELEVIVDMNHLIHRYFKS